MTRILMALGLVLLAALALLYWIGAGGPGDRWEEGTPSAASWSADAIASRSKAQFAAADELPVSRPKQVLFGDLHVHTTFSPDAFAMALPSVGGDGARPVSDACDYARFCAAMDFWSINDHAVGITPWKWEQTVEAIRQCTAVSGQGANPDLVSFVGWEWTQMGTTPDNHYGHKNVVIRGLSDEEVPERPIAAASPQALADGRPGRVLMGVLGTIRPNQDTWDLIEFNDDLNSFEDCPMGLPLAQLPEGCRDSVVTPVDLFARLDEYGVDSIVIPHGTAWGMYTPLGSAWDKQLVGANHDPKRQTLVEVFSGHGNSEEYRSWQEVAFTEDGVACPAPTPTYLPSCWRAGDIIRERCMNAGEDEAECDIRAVDARQFYAEASVPGHLTVPGSTPEEWLDSGQCTDCFQPSFNYRPLSSVQYMMAIRNFDDPKAPRRFDFGFMASSDNHSARPGTGYKEYGRTDMTETRLGLIGDAIDVGNSVDTEKRPQADPYDPEKFAGQFFAVREAERAGSFFLNGGLVAVHAEGRDRDAIWDGMQRKEVYGTSGPRMLLWFDLLNGPGSRGRPIAMGGSATLDTEPIFRVSAAGSFEQKPGCPAEAAEALGPDRLARVCGGECYNPSDTRRDITRLEIVRIRPQQIPDEPVAGLIEDPWRVFRCDPDPAGCSVTFTDPEFTNGARDALYYARAIEAESLAVGADPLGCERNAVGECVALDACKDRPDSDDCLAPTEERAWSSPIFVEWSRSVQVARP